MNYRTKGAKNLNLPIPKPLVLSDDIIMCKSSNQGTTKCDNCDNKFMCLLADIPDNIRPNAIKITKPKQVIATVDISFSGFDYNGALGTGQYDKIEEWIRDLILTVDLEKGGKVTIIKVNGKEVQYA